MLEHVLSQAAKFLSIFGNYFSFQYNFIFITRTQPIDGVAVGNRKFYRRIDIICRADNRNILFLTENRI